VQNIEKPPLLIAICEDTESDLKKLKGFIEASGTLFELDVYEDGADLIAEFTKGRYDLVFLDVFMEQLSGVETAEQIRQVDTEVVIVFATTSDDYTREGYRLNAYKYMIKPVLRSDVEESLDLALVRRDRNLAASLDIISDNKPVSIPFSEILYVESRDSRSHVVTADQRNYSTVATLDNLQTLLSPPRFLRTHRAFIVNLDHVDDVDDDFIMDNGDVAYIRVKDRKRIKNKFDDYVFSKIRSD
jgi:DNA-binding LytR/AlgR family response regulator